MGRHVDAQKLAAARLWAANRFPYLASALFACELREQAGIDTVAVDENWHIYVDPELVASWSSAELGSVLIHHVGHVLRDHAERARELGVHDDFTTWLVATDAEINDDLVASGIATPGVMVLPSHFNAPDGRLAEDYFGLLQLDGAHPTPSLDCGSACDGNHRPWESETGGRLSPFVCGLLRRKCACDILDAHARDPGSVPLGWTRWAEALLASKTDWRRILASEIRRSIADVAGAVDYSYRRPSRRAHLMPEVVLPTLRRPVPEIAIVCDTSGSMTDDLLSQSLSEVEALLRRVGVRQNGVKVYACDADVHAVRRVTSARQVELAGGGGTDMGRGIEVAMRSRPQPHIIVVLTDGYTPWPYDAPKGTKVVAGLLRRDCASPPPWVKAVYIEDTA